MDKYKLTVGLEIHAELKTKTKMFCDSKNDADETHPNVNICPVCMGHPGTLPVINKEAVKNVIKLGLAAGGKIADYTEFDRKNYFYPDIPKGYQISQYKYPLVSGGSIAGFDLTRIHLEEDTAKSIHNDNGESLLNFNRAGVPLVELVTEPVIHTPEDAARFAKEFQLLLTYLDVAYANMEKGEMRIEANISVSTTDQLGTKVEVKNLNSFKIVEKAIKYEFERQVKSIEEGKEVIQETRGWDENKGETYSQRIKEDSHDYRYFPDPDLPKLFISEIEEFKSLKETLPELPQEKRERLKKGFGLKEADIEIYLTNIEKGQLFENTIVMVNSKESAQLLSNYITSDVKKVIEPKSLAEVVNLIDEGKLSSRGAKDIIKIIEEDGGNVMEIAEKNNLIQKNNIEELKVIANKIISENKEAVDEYKKGKENSLQFMIGQVMKETKGSANPKVLTDLFKEILG